MTEKIWLKVFERIRLSATDDTTRTLAAMLGDIAKTSEDPDTEKIFDAYAYRLLSKGSW